MSTAVPEPSHLTAVPSDAESARTQRHLRPVPDHEALRVAPAAGSLATDIHPVGKLRVVLQDPVEEYEPAPDATVGRLAPIYAVQPRTVNPAVQRRYRQEQAAMKLMTQTIGSAFIEAELGLRPFMQLSSWLEVGLFQKLRNRVEHRVNDKYLAVRRGDDDSKKIPAIQPVGVRAAQQSNGDWETSMTIRVGERARAIAMRLQLHRERWRVIALEVG